MSRAHFGTSGFFRMKPSGGAEARCPQSRGNGARWLWRLVRPCSAFVNGFSQTTLPAFAHRRLLPFSRKQATHRNLFVVAHRLCIACRFIRFFFRTPTPLSNLHSASSACHSCRTSQISHARRAGKPSLLNSWAMLSADDIGESGEIKGVAAVAAGSASIFISNQGNGIQPREWMHRVPPREQSSSLHRRWQPPCLSRATG
jgi:hypothetical protein